MIKNLVNAITSGDRTCSEKFTTLRTLVRQNLKKIKRIRIMLKPKAPRFAGWGMTSKHALPWDRKNSTDLIGLKFSDIENNLKKQLREGEFVLTQFQNQGVYTSDPLIALNTLSWRHYLVFWTATLAARFNTSSSYNFVEAGTCDGLTVKFAISALENEIGLHSNYKVFLYDAWGAMKLEHLTQEESGTAGHYSYLSIEQTKSNLKEYREHCEFVKGYIPEVFSENPGPSDLSWLHIDLNSSMPTLKTLEHFLPKLVSGGVVLLDDYGHGGFSETREVADKYLCHQDGLLMPLPTGQAIFFKH